MQKIHVENLYFQHVVASLLWKRFIVAILGYMPSLKLCIAYKLRLRS